jgi:hypothetical protein
VFISAATVNDARNYMGKETEMMEEERKRNSMRKSVKNGKESGKVC